MSYQTSEADSPAQAAADSSELFAMAALRQSFTPENLLGQWIADHPDASEEAQFDASNDMIDLQMICRPAISVTGKAELSLNDGERMRILGTVGIDQARRLLSKTPEDETTDAERMLTSLLEGHPVIVDRNNYPGLSTLLSASLQAQALGTSPPVAPEDIEARIRRVNLLQALGGTDLPRFVGRKPILDALAHEWEHHFTGLRCVALEGPGGIGKSLTITRFIADLLEDRRNGPDAVYHLDFDHVELQTALPSAIWRTLIRQTKSWCAASAADDLEELAHRVPDSGDGQDGPSEISRSSQPDDMHMIAAHLLHKLKREYRRPRLLMFVDSYEQVEGYDDVAANAPQQIAGILAAQGATVLLVYASRIFKESLGFIDKKYQLKQFTVGESVAYLMRQAKMAGLEISRQEARRVQAVTGRAPLALRIAVGLLDKGDDLHDAQAWSAYLENSPEMVQALLYERLLRRIRSEELRKIAAPGLLVRRLSEEVILHVLAKPCRLELKEGAAAQLMAEAQSEGQLFVKRPDDSKALWHRADVRTTMLENVRRATKPETAIEIHELAVAYYSRGASESLLFQTEELYHRLCLDQGPDLLDASWSHEAGLALRPSMGELPRAARAYLRSRMGAATRGRLMQPTSSPDRLSRTDQLREDEFERLSRKQLLSAAPDADLLELWRKGGERLDNKRGAVFAAALVQYGQHDAMLRAARHVIDTAAAPADPKSAASVLRIAAAILEGRHDLVEAQAYWDAATGIAERGMDWNGELAGTIGRLRLRRKLGASRDKDRLEREHAIGLMQRQAKELHNQKVLEREAVAELGPELLESPVHRGLLGMAMEDLIFSNEAFPTAVKHQDRLAQLSERFLGTAANTSMRSLSSAAMRMFDSDKAREVIDTMREEVERTLVQGAWP
ncbi:MAG: hypothetical protein JWR40_2576 [Massilia sp.]|nr:hypothetical protein [Massilia sp.]